MSPAQLARRYARALWEASQAEGQLDQAEADMKALEEILAALPEIGTFCIRPHQSRRREEEFVRAMIHPVLGLHGQRLMDLAVANRRLEIIPLLPQAWAAQADAASDQTRVILEAAAEPEEELVRSVHRHMEARLGGPVSMQTEVNPQLLGGFRIKWHHSLMDHSARGRLDSLRRALKPL